MSAPSIGCSGSERCGKVGKGGKVEKWKGGKMGKVGKGGKMWKGGTGGMERALYVNSSTTCTIQSKTADC
jgi:hypothetical protein